MHIVVAGGGTAGHVEPALNVADALRRHDPSIGITALGTERGLEVRLVPERGYELALIPAVPLPRKPSKDLMTLPGRMRRAVSACEHILTVKKADAVVGFGGYVSIPAYLAARRAGVPIVIHEANAKAGLANKVGARFTPYVAETVAGSIPGATRVGVPLRPAIANLDRAAKREEACAYFGLDPARQTILVFGGSQGAQRINAATWEAQAELAELGYQVLHGFGIKNEEMASPYVGSAGYHGLAYIDRMDLAYAAADLAVCRSGAMTCGELAAVGLPAIYVPFPIGNGEQRFNALPVVEAGGGVIVEDAALTGESMVAEIRRLGQADSLGAMAEAAARYGVRDADERMVAMVLKAVAEREGTS